MSTRTMAMNWFPVRILALAWLGLFVGLGCQGSAAPPSASNESPMGQNTAAAPPTVSTESPIRRDTAAADLVFHGFVNKVEYVAADDGTPHAFVTYKVKEIIRGNLPGKGDGVTLRFLGGPRGNGSYFTRADIPNFAPGDEDVLLVRNNGIAGCPLVSCSDGRFRIVDGRVYQGVDTPVIGVGQGEIVAAGRGPEELLEVRYPPPTFEALYGRTEVMDAVKQAYANAQQKLDFQELKKAYEERAPKQIVMRLSSSKAEGEAPIQTPSADPIDTETLLSVLRTANKGLASEPSRFVSVDPAIPFSFERPKPAGGPPPSSASGTIPSFVKVTAADMELYGDDNYNPVAK